MDNDNKIDNGTNKNQRHDEVMLFLNKELKNLQKGTNKDVYDIKKEYAKTKKNKSPFTVLVLLFSAIILVAASFVVAKVISKQNQEITVALEEFDSLNLRNLLDTVFKTQDDYNTAVKNKASLEAEQTRAIKEAEAKRDNDLFVLDSLKLVKAEYNNRAKVINSECNAQISAIQAEYAPQIAELDSQIDVFQKQLAEYDNTNVQQAQEQEKALNSERQLRQLEQKELTEKYEDKITDLQESMDKLRVQNQEEIRKSVTEVQTKYQAEIDKLDPEIKDSAADAIVSAAAKVEVPKLNVASRLKIAAANDQNLVDALDTYQKYYDNYEYLNSKISAIPQQHTIPSYVAANNKLVNQMGQTFTDTTMSLYRDNIKLQKQLQDTIDETAQRETTIYTTVLTAAKANALIYASASEDNIQVFIAERARYLVTAENGVGAEITCGKVVVKGRVTLDADGIYRFRMGTDEEGNAIPLPVELSALVPGTIVKLLNK